MGRALIAVAVFLATTLFVFCVTTGAAVAFLVYLDGFRGSLGLGFTFFIFSPSLVFFLAVGVVAGLWTSHRAYSGKGHQQISD